MNFLSVSVFLLCFGASQAQISVSGVSAGGYAAVQYHVIYSSSLDGAGIIAGGPYWCAMADVVVALTSCMADPGMIDLELLYAATSYAYELDSIDNPTNLKNSKVYLFSGTEDTIVVPGVMKKLAQYYLNYVDQANIQTVFNISAEHSFVTNSWGHDCNFFGSPYINNCNYDAAGALLQHIYGKLEAPQNASTKNIQTIDQTTYIPTGYTADTAAMEDNGYYYLPSGGCGNSSSCKIHISFHGCNQTLNDIGTTYVEHVGLNDWAETNNIIVLYPQAKKTMLNPQGCFDWWGYTGLDYATFLAPQMSAVNSMVEALKSKYVIA
eukprot:TRINITY_DN8020_c0_g1_i2.p1 TRINITY_DN8020_c0_g1~~TRINITY_DN8020_c0_g1_i2.p1  ORF type:complete len:323 (+),score=66.60 TRINITY_DN8020_c0_g1_i2:150-1118(+)